MAKIGLGYFLIKIYKIEPQPPNFSK